MTNHLRGALIGLAIFAQQLCAAVSRDFRNCNQLRSTMALPKTIWAAATFMLLVSTVSAQHQIVCSGESAGGYAAFPDVCRLGNGDLCEMDVACRDGLETLPELD
jgi:hypothetical protein